jgi:regulator of sigma E protease
MGPAMNLALAVVVTAFVLYHNGADEPAFAQEPVIVGSVVADSPAAKAGIEPGDRITAVAGVRVDNWERFRLETVTKANRPITMSIVRDGKTIEPEIVPVGRGKYDEGVTGIKPILRPQIVGVEPGQPASESGLRAGDVILSVNGQKPVVTWVGPDGRSPTINVTEVIRASEGRPLSFQILRDGQPREVVVTPRRTNDLVRIGADIHPLEVRVVRPGLAGAFKLSAEQNWTATKTIMRTLGGLFTRETPVKQLMGPLGMAGLSGEAAQAGWIHLFNLMALLSLNLGLFNLLPVPVLDGGHITILALEGLSRRDFSVKVKRQMLRAGFAVLLLLMVTVIYNDLTRLQWVQGLLPWR